MKVEPFLIASTVNAIISQRLIRKLCDESEAYNLSAIEIENLKTSVHLDEIVSLLQKEKVLPEKYAQTSKYRNIEWARPQKTNDCPDGYKGRLGIHEVLEVSETIKQMTIDNASTGDIERQARKEGMLTMLEEGFIRAAQKITSIEEVLRVTSE